MKRITSSWIGNGNFARDFGIAAIVGGLISLGIERISRAELKEEIAAERSDFQTEISKEIKLIQRSAFNAAFQKQLPEAYGEMITRVMLDVRFLRMGATVTIDLIECDPPCKDSRGEDRLDYYQSTSHVVKNVTSSAHVYEPNLFLDKSWDGIDPDLMEWSVGDRSLTPQEIVAAAAVPQNSPMTKWFKFPAQIPIAPGEEVRVYARLKTIRYARDVTTWCSLFAADSLRFTVNHPKHFRVFVDAKTPALATKFSNCFKRAESFC